MDNHYGLRCGINYKKRECISKPNNLFSTGKTERSPLIQINCQTPFISEIIDNYFNSQELISAYWKMVLESGRIAGFSKKNQKGFENRVMALNTGIWV